MQVIFSGTESPHKNGEFCQRVFPDAYGIFYFLTPFLYEKDGQMLRGDAGDLLLTKPGQVVFHGPVSNSQSFVNDWMYVSKDIAPLLEKYPIPCGISVKLGSQRIVCRAVTKITQECNQKGIGYREKICCILTEMVIDLYRAQLNCGDEKSTARIESVHDQVMQAPEQDWTLEKMAETAGLSVSHLSWLWSVRYGCSPKAELLQKRLDMAQQLLIYSQLSVGEIAEKCGFQSIYYFSKYFKKHCGVSPGKFAQLQKR